MTSKPIRILGISGSPRREFYNRAALRAANKLVPEGAIRETSELDGIPVFNQDEDQNPPPKVEELKRRIHKTDAILFVTLEYNYSVPGVLKNAIDGASRPYGDRVGREMISSYVLRPGFLMPSFFIRNRRVPGSSPNTKAAPRLPSTTQSVFSRTRRM
jgi:NAD(P)H-dependent FMN reductase